MANIITLIRIGLAISLLFIKKYSLLFLIVYSICGFTDILDGYIARKTKTESNLGAKLDTVSDLLFFILYFMNLNGANIIVYIIGVIALVSSIEELAINIKSKKLDLNKKSIFN